MARFHVRLIQISREATNDASFKIKQAPCILTSEHPPSTHLYYFYCTPWLSGKVQKKKSGSPTRSFKTTERQRQNLLEAAPSFVWSLRDNDYEAGAYTTIQEFKNNKTSVFLVVDGSTLSARVDDGMGISPPTTMGC